MKSLKYILIYLAGALSVLLYVYFNKEGSTVITTELMQDMPEKCPDIRIRDMVSCPELVQCEPKIIEKVVCRTEKLGPGCHVNWKTREVKAETIKGYSLDCVVDWKNRKVDEVLFKSDMLRSRNRRPLP